MKIAYTGALAIIGLFLGLSLPAVIQAATGKLLGGDVSLDYSISLWPIEADFHNAEPLKDWQIRIVGASKLVFPLSLIAYLITLFPYHTEYRLVILVTLFAGVTTISSTDLLAIENPRDWSLQRTGIYGRHERTSILPDYLPSIQERLVTYISLTILLAIGIVALLEYQGIVNYISDGNNPPFDFATVANIVGSFGSVVFSIVLVILYDKQASISDTQSELQKEQAELARREREPRLSGPYNTRFWGSNVPKQSKLSSSATVDPRSRGRDPNPNSIQFFQTNAGEGLAQNFRFAISLKVEEGPHDGRGARCAVQRMDRFPLRKFGESDLQGGEKDVEFMSEEIKLCFTEPNPGDPPSFATYEFEEGINTLVEQGTTEISLKFTLTWEDEFDEQYSDQVYHVTSELNQNMDLLDFIR